MRSFSTDRRQRNHNKPIEQAQLGRLHLQTKDDDGPQECRGQLDKVPKI